MPYWEKVKIYNLHREGFSKSELAIMWELPEDTVSRVIAFMGRRMKRRELSRGSR